MLQTMQNRLDDPFGLFEQLVGSDDAPMNEPVGAMDDLCHREQEILAPSNLEGGRGTHRAERRSDASNGANVHSSHKSVFLRHGPKISAAQCRSLPVRPWF